MLILELNVCYLIDKMSAHIIFYNALMGVIQFVCTHHCSFETAFFNKYSLLNIFMKTLINNLQTKIKDFPPQHLGISDI